MVGANRLQQREPFTLHIKTAVAIQQALLALARDYCAKAKIAQVLLAEGLGRETMGSLPQIVRRCSSIPIAGELGKTRRSACVLAR